MFGLIGTKKGMTRVFKEDGASIPVTVIEICKSKIVQRKTLEKDGYYGIQVNYGSKKKVSKSLEKKFKGNDVSNGYLTEFNLTEEEFNKLSEVNELSVDFFDESLKVDVSGVSKGKGFAGVVKRHNFKTQDATHGNSLSHRAPGSIGQCQFPGRVFKGKKMAGQYGNKQITVQNLEIEKIDIDDSLILVQGSIPGSIGSFVRITPSIKGGVTLSLEPKLPETEEPIEDTATKEDPVEKIAEEAPVEEAPAEEAAPVISDVEKSPASIVSDFEKSQLKEDLPSFRPGDTVSVSVKVKDGQRTRLQAFEGVVMSVRNSGLNSSFIVRKISSGIGVERTFQLHSPLIDSISVKRKGDVRKAKLFYLRERSGKSARIKERLD